MIIIYENVKDVLSKDCQKNLPTNIEKLKKNCFLCKLRQPVQHNTTVVTLTFVLLSWKFNYINYKPCIVIELTELPMSVTGNKIVEIEERTFEGLDHLRVLDLDRNRIYVIHGRAFDAVPELRCLRLAGNNIRVINEETFLSVAKLQVNYTQRNVMYYFVHCSFSCSLPINLVNKAHCNCAFLFSALSYSHGLSSRGSSLGAEQGCRRTSYFPILTTAFRG